MSRLNSEDSMELAESLPYRIKKLCSNILDELEKIKSGSFSGSSLKVLSARLIQAAAEVEILSASGGLLRNLAELILLINKEKEGHIEIAESIVQTILTRFESDKYQFLVISKKPKIVHKNPGFLSQRMQSTSLISDIKGINREPKRKERNSR